MFLAANSQQNVGFNDGWWRPNDDVYTVAKSGNTVYVGGNFTYVGPHNPWGAVVNKVTGNANLSFVNPDYVVRVAVPDGVGGWYIGGDFTYVGNQVRNHIARINADGTLNPWNPNANQMVTSILLSGNKVYVGGIFDSIGGQNRLGFAELDTSNGNAAVLNINLLGSSYSVDAMSLWDGKLYIAGSFSSVGGQSRNNLAAIDTITGNVTSWNPNANHLVRVLLIHENKIYLGGDFTTLSGQLRNHLAAVDTFGNITSWNPGANSIVTTMAAYGNTIYSGGAFTTAGGTTRNYFAAFDTVNGNVTSLNPNPNNTINSIAINGNTLILGGDFTKIGGVEKNYIATIDAFSGTPTSWPCEAESVVEVIAMNGNELYVGGGFQSIGGRARKNIAAIDATTGLVTNWNPKANNNVNSISLKNSKIFVGGQFDTIGGQLRNSIAAIDSATGNVTSWNPNVNGIVNKILIKNNKVYLCGWFWNIGVQSYNNIAAVDINTGNPVSWNPTNFYCSISSPRINSFDIIGNKIYLGGLFDKINGITRYNLAAIDTLNGSLLPWHPNSNDEVKSLAIIGNMAYVGGDFNYIGSQTRNHLAAVDTTNGTPSSWNPDANGSVLDIRFIGNKMYVGGEFTNIGGQSRNYLASIDKITGGIFSWNPNAVYYVHSIISDSNTLFTGGEFTGMGGDISRHFFVSMFDSLQLTIPSISSFLPSNGCSGTNVNIYGAKFTGATQVSIGGTLVNSFTINSDTSITAVVGNGTTGIVAVTTPSGTATSVDSFTVNNITAIINPLSTTTFCSGNNVVLTANLGTGLLYQWQIYGTNISSATNSSYIATNTGDYTVSITNSINNCTTTSSIVPVSVYPTPTATISVLGPDSVCQGNSVTLSGGSNPFLNYQWYHGNTYINGATNITYTTSIGGNYSVKVTNINNCSDTSATLTITTLPVPNANITQVSTNMWCVGDSVILYANPLNAQTTYQWQNNQVNISGANNNYYTVFNTGNYSVIVNQLGCLDTSVQMFDSFMTSPIVSILQTGDTLTASTNFYSYQWYFNGIPISGATNQIYSPGQSGDYYLKVTTLYGCIGQSNTIMFTVGIEEVNGKHLFSVSPNPIKDVLTIKIDSRGQNKEGRIEVYNSVGQKLISKTISSAICQLPTGNWTAGVYMVQYDDGEVCEAVKVVKE
jgi:hypothetical protein